MQLTSSPRRALGLVAVGALGMSTAVLGVTGTASAATTTDTFSTADGVTEYKVAAAPDAECVIAWVIEGAGGGSGDGVMGAQPGASGGRLVVTLPASPGDEFELFPGGKGGDLVAGATPVPGIGGTNGYHPDYAGTGGSNSPFVGGGGGGASVVYTDGAVLLAAFGGDGGYAAGDLGIGGLEGKFIGADADSAVHGPATTTGDGVISGTVTCTTPDTPAPVTSPPADDVDPEVQLPGTPTVNWIEPGEKSALLQIWQGWVPEGAKGTPVYEYSLDKGPWKKLATSSEFQIEPTITGLVNGKTYSVRVRMTVDGVSSEPTEAQTVTPRHIVGAPTNASVTTGPGSLTITWAPPADASEVTGFEAWALPGAQPQSSAGMVECPALDASARSCTIGVPVGTEYSIGIRTLGTSGPGDAAWLVSDKVEAATAPAQRPTSTGTLSTDNGAVSTVTAGGTVTLTGGGYLPGSTVTLIMYSTPVVLGTTVADAEGNISATVTLPAGARGSHTLVAAGVDPSGKPHTLTMAVTVAGAGELPYSGADIALPALGGLAALAAGGGLLFAARRRTAA